MTEIVKQKIILIALSIVLLFSFFGFLCTSHSLAWFAANRRVEAEGLAVSAKVSPNLVIYKSADEIDDEDKAFGAIPIYESYIKTEPYDLDPEEVPSR